MKKPYAPEGGFNPIWLTPAQAQAKNEQRELVGLRPLVELEKPDRISGASIDEPQEGMPRWAILFWVAILVSTGAVIYQWAVGDISLFSAILFLMGIAIIIAGPMFFIFPYLGEEEEK